MRCQLPPQLLQHTVKESWQALRKDTIQTIKRSHTPVLRLPRPIWRTCFPLSGFRARRPVWAGAHALPVSPRPWLQQQPVLLSSSDQIRSDPIRSDPHYCHTPPRANLTLVSDSGDDRTSLSEGRRRKKREESVRKSLSSESHINEQASFVTVCYSGLQFTTPNDRFIRVLNRSLSFPVHVLVLPLSFDKLSLDSDAPGQVSFLLLHVFFLLL